MNLKKYLAKLKPHLQDKKFSGKFAAFQVDRNPDLAFCSTVRLDGRSPCIRANGGRICVVSLGRPVPEVARKLHAVEACLLQGLRPVLARNLSRVEVFRGCGNAMCVPVVGSILAAVARAQQLSAVTAEKSESSAEEEVLDEVRDGSQRASEASTSAAEDESVES